MMRRRVQTARMGMPAAMAVSTHNKKNTAKAKLHREQPVRSARIEARRWAALTAWQAGRYLAAADRLPGEVPPSTSMEDLRRYFEDHDHAIAEADYLTASAVRLSVLLRSAGVKRKGKNGEQVTTIRNLADQWDPPKHGSTVDERSCPGGEGWSGAGPLELDRGPSPPARDDRHRGRALSSHDIG